jgi:spore maturation protein CgeB
MKALLYDMGAYTQNDLVYYLKKRGIACRSVYYRFKDQYEDEFFTKRFERYLTADDYDCVISINFFPLVARICSLHNIKYLSWSYDSPLSHEKYEYFPYETNHIFLFDRLEYETLRAKGYQTVHHLPLGVNVERWDAIKPAKPCAVSLVGRIYESQLAEIAAPLSPYDRGYLDSVVAAQSQIYGHYFVDDMLSPALIERICAAHASQGNEIEIDLPRLSLAIATQITGRERLRLLKAMGERFPTLLFSRTVGELPPGVTYGGTARYFDEMPQIFKSSKINLNPTLKSIRSGIPLRALDILGCGGFLLSNYQLELAEYFIPGEEVAVYDSIEDAVAKAEYYVNHDGERERIAKNGYRKAREQFSFAGQLAKALTSL